MFIYCRPEDAAAEHQRLLAWEKQMLAKIELPYRVIDTAAGDLGGPAARKFDCEAWVPDPGPLPRADLDLQLHDVPGPPARHPRARRRRAGTRHVATLNGTLATTRWIVAILENHQQPDGSVVVPQGAAAVPRPRRARPSARS